MASLTLTQPLLRGFGPAVNKVRINQAVKGELQAVLGVQAKMLGVIRDVETLYWELAYGQKHAEVAQNNLATAEDLIRRLERLKTAGLATALDVSQAEVAAEVRRADLVRAGADLLNSQSQFRALIDPDLPVGTRVVALENPPEEPAPVDLQEKIDRAVVRRPEMRLQQSIIETVELEERQAKNNRLWTLDASAGLTYGGLAGKDVGPGVFGPLPGGLDDRNSFDDAVRDSVPSWAVGLKLEIPLGNRVALAGLESSRLKLHQEEMRLALIRSQITVEVETSFQEMVAMRSALDSARQAVDLAGKQLEAETRNLDAGRSTARRVLEAQDNLAGARNFELRTLSTFAAARTRLLAAQALSFEIYRMEMVP
jgi:outer membrane protein TolC